MGDSMERYPEGCFHIIAPGQPKFDFNTSSISPLYETTYKNIIFYHKQIKNHVLATMTYHFNIFGVMTPIFKLEI